MRQAGPTPHFFNDLEVAADGTVYVTDSVDGSVWRLAPGAGELELLVTSPAWAFAYRGDLLAVQNSAGLNRLVHIVLAPGGGEAERIEVLHGALPTGRIATTGTMVDGEWWVTTSASWVPWPPVEPPGEPEILRVRPAGWERQGTPAR
ncbi:MAG: hypothetical protein R6X35_03535 [Candidatus Krumholzibacteriia bacterium]